MLLRFSEGEEGPITLHDVQTIPAVGSHIELGDFYCRVYRVTFFNDKVSMAVFYVEPA
jgi:hypothetical protein